MTELSRRLARFLQRVLTPIRPEPATASTASIAERPSRPSNDRLFTEALAGIGHL